MKPADLMNNPLQPIRPNQPATGPGKSAAEKSTKPVDFSKVLAGKVAEQRESSKAETLQFSAHAQSRLQERNITLSEHNLQRLDHGVELAAAKGSVNSLVLMDDTAFIVSVKNRTVVTAIPRHDAVDNVFTQIDSATIV